MSAPDVAIVGGGILGTAAAAFLAADGARVELFERATLAAAASGRNSGAIQHPYDAALVDLHRETVAHYRALPELSLDAEPAGTLVLAREQDAAALAGIARDVAEACPELEPALLDASDLAEAEPLLAPGLAACRLRTGWPVRPEAATLGYARLARERGAVLHTGASASVWREGQATSGGEPGRPTGGFARGVVVDGERRPAGAVLVAAGPWTPEVVDPTGGWRPIQPVWGVNVEVALPVSPRHVLEEAGVEFAMGGAVPPQLFSLVSAEGACALGSTFLADEPDPDALAPGLLRHGAAFVPSLADVREAAPRVCARPLSADGRPLLGPLPDVENLWVASGHGPWGISLGPASARVVAAAMRDDGSIPADLAVARTCAA